MRLNYNQKKNLIGFLPKLELSYIKNIHKKVCSDVCLLIPKGQKYIAWFKCWNNKNTCFILNIDNRSKRINDVFIYDAIFDYNLCAGRGTIMYGTVIKNKTNIFCIEDIFYYKSRNINFETFNIKLNYINKFFKYDVRQTAYKKNDIIFSLPLMDKSYNNIIKKLDNIPYIAYCIQFKKLHNSKSTNLQLRIKHEIKRNKVFQVRPCIIEDLYELYVYDNSELIKYNYAYIPNYKLSIYMNSLFRNIKENNNLDLLEESDDEEEFENIALDKYVYLEKKINMICEFNNKMKMWIPIKISNEPIVKKKNIF